MSLVRFKSNPVVPTFDRLFRNILSDDFDGFFVKPFTNNFSPAVNVVEGKENFRLEIAVPGFSKNDFNVKLDNNLLTVSAEKKNEVKKDEENYTMREFSHSSFSRTFTLPEAVDASKISAEYTDGILKLVLPKKEEVKQKSLEIKVS
ncbi:MAG TPA: Hsp20/alpha crystallin family protein [Chitinophagales bacterium]|nr:Hsp20/alpha crystallin family protein [Chitinophagales bacterium]